MKNSLALCTLLCFTTSVSVAAKAPAPVLEHIEQMSETELTMLIKKLIAGTDECSFEKKQEAHVVLEAIMGMGTLSTLLFVVVIINAFLSGKMTGEELFAMVDYKGLGFGPEEKVKNN
ncbi:hypothetical protein K2W90_00185 [Candidatus Babeliales bacterium]|nr:hypothetical protein [Candidatus Babeliales bacterium]